MPAFPPQQVDLRLQSVDLLGLQLDERDEPVPLLGFLPESGAVVRHLHPSPLPIELLLEEELPAVELGDLVELVSVGVGGLEELLPQLPILGVQGEDLLLVGDLELVALALELLLVVVDADLVEGVEIDELTELENLELFAVLAGLLDLPLFDNLVLL